MCGLLLLQGGSVFSPSLVQTPSSSRRQADDLAKELGCVTSDLAACLRATPVHTLNAAQTKVEFKNQDSSGTIRVQFLSCLTCPPPCPSQLLAVSGPFRSWSPVRQSVSQSSFHRVDLLLGTTEQDGLIGRARRIKVRGHGRETQREKVELL